MLHIPSEPHGRLKLPMPRQKLGNVKPTLYVKGLVPISVSQQPRHAVQHEIDLESGRTRDDSPLRDRQEEFFDEQGEMQTYIKSPYRRP